MLQSSREGVCPGAVKGGNWPNIFQDLKKSTGWRQTSWLQPYSTGQRKKAIQWWQQETHQVEKASSRVTPTPATLSLTSHSDFSNSTARISDFAQCNHLNWQGLVLTLKSNPRMKVRTVRPALYFLFLSVEGKKKIKKNRPRCSYASILKIDPWEKRGDQQTWPETPSVPEMTETKPKFVSSWGRGEKEERG